MLEQKSGGLDQGKGSVCHFFVDRESLSHREDKANSSATMNGEIIRAQLDGYSF